MSSLDFETILLNLGYNIQDRGSYWQSSAVYRNGDNPSALQIYKDTGVWKDYVTGDSFLPFKALVIKTIGEDQAKKILQGLSISSTPSKTLTNAVISSSKTFPKDMLNYLLPHYDFYNNKGIKSEILSYLKSGLCTSGSMYQRFVFPVFNHSNQIIGLAGRDLSNSPNRPKWKHMGKKTSWAYPYHTPIDNNVTKQSITNTKEVILVESIGDMLALFNNNIKNVLVTFGLDISTSLISLLMGLNLDRIIISFNNDNSKDLNSGLLGSLKSYLKLVSYFNDSKLFICLPNQNDFGDMSSKNFKDWLNKKESIIKNTNKVSDNVLKLSKKYYEGGKISKNLYKNIKYIL